MAASNRRVPLENKEIAPSSSKTDSELTSEGGPLPPEKKKSYNFTKRVLAALILGPIAIWAVLQGGIYLVVLAAVSAAIGAYEWVNMTAQGEVVWKRAILTGILSAGGVASVILGANGLPPVIAVAFLAAILAGGIGWLFKIHPLSLVFGAVYVALPFGAFIYIRELSNQGDFMLLALFAIVWGTDSAAYLAGKAYGGPLLAPKSSPSKTWTGAIGGILFAALSGAAVANLTQTSALIWLVWAVFISIATQLGDLLESNFKRKFGIKDMSNIIPGHGGLLDRLDGFLVAVTIAAFLNFLLPNLISKLLEA